MPSSVRISLNRNNYYEFNYVYHLLGNHAKAARLIRRGINASQYLSKERVPKMDYVAALANKILCELAMHDTITPKLAKDFEHSFQKLEDIAMKHGKYWGGRWAINCAAHALQISIKTDDKDNSWSALHRLRELYFNLDISTEWDVASRQTVSLLEGLVHVIFPRNNGDLNKGIGLLARSFMSRVGHKQRPEGIRDAGFGLMIGLRKKGSEDMKPTTDVLEWLMQKTVDGTSTIWPWRSK